MPVNPHVKGGVDVPLTDGGTGASDAATGLSNLGGLNAAAHAVINHAGIPGVGDLTTAAHGALDHTGIPGIGKVAQVVANGTSAASTVPANVTLDDNPFASTEGIQITSVVITPTNASSLLLVFATSLLTTDANSTAIMGLFNGGSNAVATNASWATVSAPTSVSILHTQVAGGTSAQTWSIRGGCDVGTLTVNGAAGTRLFSTSRKSTIVVVEITP